MFFAFLIGFTPAVAFVTKQLKLPIDTAIIIWDLGVIFMAGITITTQYTH